MASSRFPLALSRDQLVPEHLGRMNTRFQTPHYAVLVTGGFMVLSLFLPLEVLIKSASSVLILTYLFSCIAVIILRESHLQNYRPRFRCPLYPGMQLVGMLGCAFLLLEMGMEALQISLLLVVSGLAFYWFYGRIRANREYALLHLIERVTAKEMTQHGLETELKEIVRERDDILMDRFDHLIESCPVLDSNGTTELEAFFELAAQRMAPRIGPSAEKILQMLIDREASSPTALNPYLAIPHVIVEGEGVFDIMLARSREGIHFSESAPKVHAVFFLMGSMDERHFHLTCLANLAQIVQGQNFEKRWMRAKTNKALRDVILLAKRKR
jgi:mannitol/fructose-specific phosphotransferase system IIA component (Ntr-type)